MITSFFQKLLRAATSPRYAVYRQIGRRDPEYLRKRQMRLAQQTGVNKSFFILSFDCDTDWDAEVVNDVHNRLRKSGISPVYAVPGQLLEQTPESYNCLKADGAEFINHGYHVHSTVNRSTRTYESSYFYDRLSLKQIEDDIVRGHVACANFLGKNPTGFRTPHFGTFQGLFQLRSLYRLLVKLEYQYSSSTIPYFGYLRGPLWEAKPKFYEIPVSGCFDTPFTILDSYSFRAAQNRIGSPEDYLDQIRKWTKFMLHPETKGILNIYADPSQVYDWPDFFAVMAELAPIACSSYTNLLDQIQN